MDLKWRFNPYSTGFYSFIIHAVVDSLGGWHEFQSLFYWILFFYTIRERTRHNSKWGFNPYSTGFYSFIRIKEIEDAMQKLSFNPYSTGFYSFIVRSVPTLMLLDKFQSLFYWILFFYKLYNFFNNPVIFCFNPYSTGFYSFIY